MHVVSQGCVVGSVEDAGSRRFGGCRGSVGRAGTRCRARVCCRASSDAIGRACPGTRSICCRSRGTRSPRRRARDACSIRRRARTRSPRRRTRTRSPRRRARCAGVRARITRATSAVILRGRLGGISEFLGHWVGDARGGRGVLRHGVERLGHVVVVVAGGRVALRELLQGGDILVGEARGVVVDGDLGDVDGRVVDDRGGIVDNGRGVIHVVNRRVVHDVVHRGLDDGVDLALVGHVVHDDVGLHVVHDERGGVGTHLVGDGLGHHELLGGDVFLGLVERLAGGRLIGEQHAGEGARARHLEGADGDDVGVAHAGRGQRRGQHVGGDVVQVGGAHVDAARGGGADKRAAVGGVANLLVGNVTVEVGMLIFIGHVDDIGPVHVRAEVVDDGLFLSGCEVGSDRCHHARIGVGGGGNKGSRHDGGRDGASDTTRTNRGNVHTYLLSGSYALRMSIPARCGGGLCAALRLGGSLAMTREVRRLACSGVDLAMMRWRSYRLAPACGTTFGLGIQNGRHRLLRCRPHGRALFCLRTLLNEGGVNRGHGSRTVEVDAVGAILLADGKLAGQTLAAAGPQLGRGGEHHV